MRIEENKTVCTMPNGYDEVK